MAWKKFINHFFNSFIQHLSNYRHSEKMVYLLSPPESVRGMEVLNRDAFTSNYQVPCLHLGAIPNHDVMPALKKYLLKVRNFKAVKKVENDSIVHLDPQKVEKFDDIDEGVRDIISKFTTKIDITTLTLTYDNWSPEQILKAIFPNGMELPTSYTKIGHIIHFNLRENQLPYKHIIGQVYLDNIPRTKTVVNKLNNIETEFRYFAMEILAGDDNTITTVKENNCTFTFDFAKVYWNSRLCTEHANLLKFMNKNDVLYDVFAGVGPFAIPAGRRGVTVLANDLNPDSFRWLQSNVLANKTKTVTCFNKDGREFLRNDVRNHLLSRRRSNADGVEHIAMNLPALAHEFLDVFRNWMNDDDIIEICKKPPLIHLYCFVKVAKNVDPKPVAQSLVECSIGHKLSAESLKIIHYVRNVAPNKEMMRVSFYLTKDMVKLEEPRTMGKNKKVSKTKNVFRVPPKGSTMKAKTLNKSNVTKKSNQNTLKKKSHDKIKAVDQQLMTLRSKVRSGEITKEPEKSTQFPSKTEPLMKLKSRLRVDSDIMQQLKI